MHTHILLTLLTNKYLLDLFLVSLLEAGILTLCQKCVLKYPENKRTYYFP